MNIKSGIGRNIPCDLYNEHMNKLIKFIITNMGSNLTESSLQHAVRSVATLEAICQKFDKESCVPYGTSAHSTISDDNDVRKVISILLTQKILIPTNGRNHRAFSGIHLNPLHKWDVKLTKEWMEKKKVEYLKHGNKFKASYDTNNDNNNSGDEQV